MELSSLLRQRAALAHRAARLCEELAARGLTVPTPGDIFTETVAAQVEGDRAWLEHLQSACVRAGIDLQAPAPRTRDATLAGERQDPESDVLGEVRRIAERLEELNRDVKILRVRGPLEAEVDDTRDRIDELRAREIVLMLEAIAVAVGVNLRSASLPASELVLGRVS